MKHTGILGGFKKNVSQLGNSLKQAIGSHAQKVVNLQRKLADKQEELKKLELPSYLTSVVKLAETDVTNKLKNKIIDVKNDIKNLERDIPRAEEDAKKEAEKAAAKAAAKNKWHHLQIKYTFFTRFFLYISSSSDITMTSTVLQEQIIALSADYPSTVVKRHQMADCYALYDDYVREKALVKHHKWPTLTLPTSIRCYGCGNRVHKTHSVYIFSCKQCGQLFNENRYMERNLSGKIALVTGCRTKLGHQIVRKLLDAGATVIGLTRQPDAAYRLFKGYADYATFASRLHIFAADLDVPNLQKEFLHLYQHLNQTYGVLDILINSAAQTIRSREKEPHDSPVKNRYQDAKHVPSAKTNSWCETITDLTQEEMEELFRINAIAPTLLIQVMLPLLQNSTQAYVVNVHAREGNFTCRKSKFHMQTNMAKAALHMSTLMLHNHGLRSHNGKKLRFHGICPSWISAEEYYENESPWIYPPQDEIDGAARVLYPVFKELSGQPKTRKHYLKFLF